MVFSDKSPNLGLFFCFNMAGIILGEKSVQSQKFNDLGERIPTTFIRTSSCHVVKIINTDKYCAVKLGFGQTKKNKKSIQGELTKAGIKNPLRFLKEFRLDRFKGKFSVVDENGKKILTFGSEKLSPGQSINPGSLFKKGDLVDVSGISKGKGFQGVVKRHHFAGGYRTHGQSDRERAPGSIGQTTTPGRIYKGKRMAGRMGGERVTVKNLQVIEVKEDGLIVKGVVPGGKNGLLEIRSY